MDILVNNPISLMYGPYFLVFYGIVIVITIMGCYFILQGNTFSPTAPKITAQLDSYEIAYLRNGEKAVAQLVCLELMQKGFLQVENNLIKISPNTLNTSGLKPIEKTVFNWISQPRMASDFNYDYTFNNAIGEHCETYKQSLETSGDLNSPTKISLVGGISAFIILGLGSYKLISALSRGHHNIMFLILMAIFATVILAIITNPFHRRITAKGRQYLDNLKLTFSGLIGNLQTPPTEPDYNSSLLLAIFDLDNFKTSGNYQDFVYLFVPKPKSIASSSKTRNNDSSSCSSSCNSSICSTSSCSSSCSSSSCGSSCGGGCGGCGG